jgi:hypothetical protein
MRLQKRAKVSRQERPSKERKRAGKQTHEVAAVGRGHSADEDQEHEEEEEQEAEAEAEEKPRNRSKVTGTRKTNAGPTVLDD